MITYLLKLLLLCSHCNMFLPAHQIIAAVALTCNHQAERALSLRAECKINTLSD